MMPSAKRIYRACVFSCLLLRSVVHAQTTPFTANWNFEGNSNGSSSSGLVTASAVTYTGVNLSNVSQYSAGYVNLGANVQNWSTTACNQTEYVQFSVQPVGTATITLTTLSFAFARSAQGPQQLTVRSSVDGFSSNIYTQNVSTNYQIASIALTGAGFSNQSNAITFRIYACNPTAGGGTIKLDEIQLNAVVLPVTLVSFTAKSEGDRVQLSWETANEYNADHFLLERSYDLSEFVSVGEVMAHGTTNEPNYYGLTDLNPKPGANYYRLKQIDFNGTVHTYRPISTIVRATEPAISVYPNPGSADHIHVRLWNADEATLRLLTIQGEVVKGQVIQKPGEADFRVEQPLSYGAYWLEVQTNRGKQAIKVLIE